MGYVPPPPAPRKGASDEEWKEHFRILKKNLWWTNFRLLLLYLSFPIVVIVGVVVYLIRWYWNG